MSMTPSSAEASFLVRIIDQSADSEDNVVEDIGPFGTIEDANLFARRYVRDSVERCRATGMTGKQVLDAWFAFGEDAVVPDTELGWKSGAELADFADRRAGKMDRDWRSLDPRLHGPDDDDDAETDAKMGDQPA